MKYALVAVWLLGCGAAVQGTSSDSVETRAAAMVDAFTNTSPRLTADGHVVFISNRDGVPLLYVGEVAHPSAPPRKLPTGNQRVAAPSLLPDGKTIVFLSDIGTNQKFHVFAIEMDGSHLVDLTPADDLRRGSLHVARDSGALFYTGHTLEDQKTHVFTQTLSGQPQEIYTDPRPGYVVDVAPDGSRLLFLSVVSDTSKFLMVVDTKLRSAQAAIYGGEGRELAIGDAKFSADGASVIYAVDRRGEPSMIVRAKLFASEPPVHYEEATAKLASIVDLTTSPKGDRIVALLDAGDHSELRMLDATTLQLQPLPNLPLASYDAGEFTSDGATLSLAQLSATGPAEIAALDVATGSVKPLRDEPRTGLGAPPRASIERTWSRIWHGRTGFWRPSSG